MTTINIYLTFDGNCEEAFTFYKSVFGGEFQYIGKYGDMPSQNDIPAVNENEKNKIMHITLPISKETMLMGADNLQTSVPLVMGNNFTISIKMNNKTDADIVFEKLSKGGQVTLPMKETFWGSYYGNITDQFGINWKMNVDLDEAIKN